MARRYPCAVMARLGRIRRVRSPRDQVNEGTDGYQEEPEQEAGAFAMEHLIPRAVWTTFRQHKNISSPAAVRTIAATQGISPSIVVGRLQPGG